MMKQSAISVKELFINYKYADKRSLTNVLKFWKKKDGRAFSALRGISFEVPQGGILGIIGKNGSGKSTLLRAIAGIFSPDKGTIDLHGHSVSLLSIGVGFNKELTGRENIFLSGLLLGFTEKEIQSKTDEIIRFAELGDFIDRPVKTYSSGMHSKLAFSITAILETDIILVDEVLSVGDAKFKKKSFEKMKDLIMDQNRTVVIVSHSTDTLKQLCDQVMWLHEGEIKMIGTPDQVLPAYVQFMQ